MACQLLEIELELEKEYKENFERLELLKTFKENLHIAKKYDKIKESNLRFMVRITRA